MASSSSYAQLDGIEFKISELVRAKPFKFKPLQLNIRDPTDTILNSEHDFSTEKRVLEWATVKHHRASLKRQKPAVNDEMRQELENKLRSFVNTQKKTDNVIINGKHSPNIESESTSISVDTVNSRESFSSGSISPPSNRSSPNQIMSNNGETSHAPPNQTNDIPPVPLPRQQFPVSQNNFLQSNAVNFNAVSTSNLTPPTNNPFFQGRYSPNNPFLSDLNSDSILQPQPANNTSTKPDTAQSDSTKIWVDFENNDLDPFTNVELKSLDDMKELYCVLDTPTINTVQTTTSLQSSSQFQLPSNVNYNNNSPAVPMTTSAQFFNGNVT